MKNSSKKIFSEKENKEYRKNSKSNSYSKNTNASKKKNRNLINSSKNKVVNKFNESNRNKSNFSAVKRRKPITKSDIEAKSRVSDNYQDLSKVQ